MKSISDMKQIKKKLAIKNTCRILWKIHINTSITRTYGWMNVQCKGNIMDMVYLTCSNTLTAYQLLHHQSHSVTLFKFGKIILHKWRIAKKKKEWNEEMAQKWEAQDGHRSSRCRFAWGRAKILRKMDVVTIMNFCKIYWYFFNISFFHCCHYCGFDCKIYGIDLMHVTQNKFYSCAWMHVEFI